MSFDGRDESPGDGDPEAGGLTSPQVPNQGGPGGVQYLGGSVDDTEHPEHSGYPEYLDDPAEGSPGAARGQPAAAPRGQCAARRPSNCRPPTPT